MDLRPILAANVATEECHTRCNLGRRCFHRVNYHSGKTMKTQESGLEMADFPRLCYILSQGAIISIRLLFLVMLV